MKIHTKTTARPWKALLGSVIKLLDEASLEFTDQYIESKNMMVGNSALSYVVWDKSLFEEYNVEEKIRFGFKVDNMDKILKRFDDDDIIIVEYDNGKMYFKTDRKKFEMNCIQASERFPKDLTDRNDFIKFDVTYDELKDLMNDLMLIDDVVDISSEKGKVTFQSRSDDGKSTITLEKDSINEIATTTVSSDYIQDIVTYFGKYSESIKFMFFNKGYIMFKIVVKNLGEISYLIAPLQDRK